MRTIALLVIFISISTLVLSQDYYRPGLIITNDNDTLKGLINDKEWIYIPNSIEFRKSAESEVRTFTSKEIKGFATSRGVYFEAYQFKFDADMLDGHSNSPTNPLSSYPTSRTPVKWLDIHNFLEVLVKGKFTLLKYTDRDDRIHFFILDENSNDPEELQYRTYQTVINGAPSLNVSENYKQQLVNRASGNCAKLKGKIQTTVYKESQLVSMVGAMNACFGNTKSMPAVAQAKNEIKKAKFGVLVDVFYSKSDLYGVEYTGLGNLQFGGGISYEIPSRQRPNRLSYYLDLKFRNFKKEEGKYRYGFEYRTVSFQTMKLTTMFRFSGKKMRSFFFNGGINFGMRINNKIDIVNYQFTTTPPYTLDQPNVFEMGLSVGFGRKFERLGATLEIRGDYEKAIPLQPMQVENINFGITIGKQF